jgi:hypothetical protein
MSAAFAAQKLTGLVTCPGCLGMEWVFDWRTDEERRHWHCAGCQRILLEGRDPRQAGVFVLVGPPAWTVGHRLGYKIPFAEQRLEFP